MTCSSDEIGNGDGLGWLPAIEDPPVLQDDFL
jgi:hypothetical protein